MKLKNNLSSYEINRLLSDAWLNVNVDDSELWNPLSEIPPSLEDDPQLYITWLMMQPEYMSFVCSQIFNIEIFPLQGVILSQLWQHKFPMLIASRGASKSSSLAIYSLLRMLLLPGRKIILCGAGFRQSKLIFDYMENIWNNSPLLRDICRGSQQGPQHGTDVWSFRIGESITKAIPIGTGEKIRGQRANDIICDEFDAINRDIFETVIAGFAAVSSNPIDAMKHEARKKLAKEIGFNLPKQQKDEVDKPNQIIISGTAGYEFNHFCQYWRKWKQFILSNGDEKELNQLFNGKIPLDFDHKDYCILRLPIELIPRGFMDPAQIARSKATLHSGIFQMEFSAVFSKDSSGFFKRSLIESCIASPDNSIVINGNSVVYGPKIRGDKKARYVFGVDPASEVDKFSIVILEVHPSHRRIVYCWTTNKKEHRERIRTGVTKETDFYSFCARKIRDLMKVFPCERIAIDAQGGGYPIIECLHNKNLIEYGEKPLWPVVIADKSQDSDGEYGDHIINVVQFTDYKWTSEANHSLRLDFESKKCLFPYKDTMDIAIAMGEKELSENLYDTLEDCIFDIEELKNELSYIVITKTNSGRDRWDTPEMKLPGNKKGRLRKDRYSALVMSNMIARNLEMDTGPLNYDTQADWSRKSSKDDSGPKMIGPQWAIDSLGNLYD